MKLYISRNMMAGFIGGTLTTSIITSNLAIALTGGLIGLLISYQAEMYLAKRQYPKED